MIDYCGWTDTRGDLVIGEGSQVLETSSPLVLISHFDQQDENSSLFWDATFVLSLNDEA
jgi:hypothetical protein